MTAEVWVAFGALAVTVLIAVLGAAWRLSAQLSSAITKLDVRDQVRERDITRLTASVDKIENAVSLIAADRERMAGMERRLTHLEAWYDELRRGVGVIVPARAGT